MSAVPFTGCYRFNLNMVFRLTVRSYGESHTNLPLKRSWLRRDLRHHKTLLTHYEKENMPGSEALYYSPTAGHTLTDSTTSPQIPNGESCTKQCNTNEHEPAHPDPLSMTAKIIPNIKTLVERHLFRFKFFRHLDHQINNESRSPAKNPANIRIASSRDIQSPKKKCRSYPAHNVC